MDTPTPAAHGLATAEAINDLAAEIAGRTADAVVRNLRDAGIDDPVAEAEIRRCSLLTATLTIVRRLYETADEQWRAVS